MNCPYVPFAKMCRPDFDFCSFPAATGRPAAAWWTRTPFGDGRRAIRFISGPGETLDQQSGPVKVLADNWQKFVGFDRSVFRRIG